MGFTGVSFPSAALFAAVGGVQRAMQALMREGSFDAVEKELVPLDDYYDLVGLQAFNAAEKRWVEDGEAIVRKRRGLAK